MATRALITLLAFLALAAPAGASTGQAVAFEGSSDLLQDASWQSTLDDISSLGARSLRIVLYWRDVAPDAGSATRPTFDATNPAAYPGLARYDRVIAAARARGMRILLTVSGPVPRWATASKRDNVTRPSAREFRFFMTALGRRYGGSVRWWGIWNEPNHPGFLGPQFSRDHRALSPMIYRSLYLNGVRGLRAAGITPTVLLGETAPRGTGRVVAPITFLRGVLCLDRRYHRRRACSRVPASGYAHHAYSTRQGPFFRPPGRNDVTIGVLSRLTRALDRAGRAGALRRGIGVYLTEFGVQSYPDKLLGVPALQQAEFRSLSEQIAYRNPRVRMFSQYLMRDSEPVPTPGAARYSGFESGLRYADGSKKPAYDEFRTPLVAHRRGSRVTLWGLVRPARGATTVRVEYRAGRGAWRRLVTRRTNARGYWRATSAFRSSRRWRVVWTAPSGEAFAGPPVRAY